MTMTPGFLSEQTLSAIAEKHGIIKDAVKGRGTEIATLVFQNAEVFAGAFGAGWANGRFAAKGKDHMALGGVPLDLAAGALGSIAAAFDAFGPMNTHVAHLAMGVASGYFYRMGLNQGSVANEKMNAPPPAPQVSAPQTAALAPAQPAAAAEVADRPGVPAWAR